MLDTILAQILKRTLETLGTKIADKGAAVATSTIGMLSGRFGSHQRLEYLASDESFQECVDWLTKVLDDYRAVYAALDKTYGLGFSEEGLVTYRTLAQMISSLDEIERLQSRIERHLGELDAIYPSISILIGSFLLEAQDPLEIMGIVCADDLSDKFMMMTFTPRILHSRAGAIARTRQTLIQNLEMFRDFSKRDGIDPAILVQLRRYERLSYIAGTAVGCSLKFVKATKKRIDVAPLVEANILFNRAMRQLAEVSRNLPKDGRYGTDVPSHVYLAVEQMENGNQVLNGDPRGASDAESCRKSIKHFREAIKLLNTPLENSLE